MIVEVTYRCGGCQGDVSYKIETDNLLDKFKAVVDCQQVMLRFSLPTDIKE